MKKLPIGIQDFAKLRRNDYLYVDKTEHVYRLINTGSYLFLFRPRRFGKSLLVATLKELFLGHKEWFKGLWIEDKIDWEPYPIVHVDMNAIDYRNQSLEEELDNLMASIARSYQISLSATTSKNRFTELLQTLSQNGKNCVVLIDEYDKPITDLLTEPDKAAEHVKVLKNFYGVLKSQDQHIHLAFITGVSKYGKVSIFSDLNNLYDITTDPEFATLTGYTPEEVAMYFKEHQAQVATTMKVSEEQLLAQMKYWYNGYSWDAKTSVYNPFSLMSFFQMGSFRNYWFSTGTPTFLTQELKQQQTAAYELSALSAPDSLLASGDLDHVDIIALLFQTGYLTIKAAQPPSFFTEPRYTLGFPNREVAVSFQQYLLAEYLEEPVNQTARTYVLPLIDSLLATDWETFFSLVQSAFSSIPYVLFDKKEKYFHSIMHVLLGTTGMQTYSEVLTNRGRMDTVVVTLEHVLIFEFKIDQPAAEALQQIQEQGYAERFGQADKRTVLIGVSFSTEDRGVGEWVVEKVTG